MTKEEIRKKELLEDIEDCEEAVANDRQSILNAEKDLVKSLEYLAEAFRAYHEAEKELPTIL